MSLLKIIFVFVHIMSEIKQISIKIWVTLIDILLFAYKIISQIILPNKRTKGNVLTSLFTFFIGLIERLNQFEHGFFNIATLLKQKYVKRTVLIVGSVLFLLSSFEWADAYNDTIQESYVTTEQVSPTVSQVSTVQYEDRQPCYSMAVSTLKRCFCKQSIFYRDIRCIVLQKKYLLICNLRI